jgi:hypothetical protein
LVSRLEKLGGSHSNAVIDDYKLTVFLLFSQSFIDVSSMTGGSEVGVDSYLFTSGRVWKGYGVVDIRC